VLPFGIGNQSVCCHDMGKEYCHVSTTREAVSSFCMLFDKSALPAPLIAELAVPKGMEKWESSFGGGRLDQVPAVAVKIFEDGHDAISF